MSSALAKFSQIPVRSKFLIVLRDLSAGSSGFDAQGAAAFTLDGTWGVDIGTIALGADLDAIAAPAGITTGQLYRDLGRQIMVVDETTSAHLALFREAILQNGAGSEGPADATGATVWLCVWRADGTQVGVARTG
jgi:hypothetical protein